MRGSSGAGVPRSASRLIAAAPTAVRQSTRASCTSSASSAVCAWVPLMNASPSFGANRNGASPAPRERRCRRRRAARLEHLAFAHEHERDVAQRRQVAAGAHAPLLRHQRDDAGVEQRDERVDQLRPHAAGGTQEHVGTEQHERAHDRRPASGVADAGGMAPDQVGLELVELVGRDPHVGELAEAGVDAVDRPPRGDGGLDQAPAAAQRLPRRGRHGHPHRPDRARRAPRPRP